MPNVININSVALKGSKILADLSVLVTYHGWGRVVAAYM